MGDLEAGFEEMEGVKLGYLVIEGKQMFALSQVFADLLKNIPRNTVHKRMDHLKVKKHHCDLEELRRLKAINSVAFNAAQCALISREDVEALWVSCKTERVVKSRIGKANPQLSDIPGGDISSKPRYNFWEEQVCLSLQRFSEPTSFKIGSRREELISPPASNLPRIYCKFFSDGNQSVANSEFEIYQNYEKAQIPSNCVSFKSNHSIYRKVVRPTQPAFHQSAIAAHRRLSCGVGLICKRKREQAGRRSEFCNACRQSSRVLLFQKCCKTKTYKDLNRLHLEHKHNDSFPDNCSSDTSGSFSEQPNYDSDFGSGLSTTSYSGTSDDEEDDTRSESSDFSTDDDGSSQSDSSSVSSRVSSQSIRFRRTSFSATNSNAFLEQQPIFNFDFQNNKRDPRETTLPDFCVSKRKSHKSDLTTCSEQLPREISLFQPLPHAGIPDNPKITNHTVCSFKELGSIPYLSGDKEHPPHSVSGQENNCPSVVFSQCTHEKEKIDPPSAEDDPSLAGNFSKDAAINQRLHLRPPTDCIKREDGGPFTPAKANKGDFVPTGTWPTLSHKPKIKEGYDARGHSGQTSVFGTENQCSTNVQGDTNGQFLSDKCEFTDSANNLKTSREATRTISPKSPSTKLEIKSNLSTTYPGEADYKNCAMVRKNYRTLVLGKQSGHPRTLFHLNAKSYSTRTVGKPECYKESDHFTGASKRKRTVNNIATEKKTFNLMANFPSPPSLVIGIDGDLSPAYSLNSLSDKRPPHRAHPVWEWRLGGSVLPLPPSHTLWTF